jgi:hypothetical protein
VKRGRDSGRLTKYKRIIKGLLQCIIWHNIPPENSACHVDKDIKPPTCCMAYPCLHTWQAQSMGQLISHSARDQRGTYRVLWRIFFFFAEMGFELRFLYWLGRCSITWATLPAKFF